MIMASRPKQHHYVPQFYLAGFTMSGTTDDRIYVFDQGEIRQWPTTPANAAKQRGFYAVDLGNAVDPNVVETEILARLEGDFSRVLRTILAQQKLPIGDDLNWFLNFIAVMATRTPRTRQMVAQVTDVVSKRQLRAMVSTADGWEQFTQILNASGAKLHEAEREQFRRFILSDDYQVDLDQTSHVQQMVNLVEPLLPALAGRTWSLGIVTDDAPDLICSDVPLAVWPTTDADSTKPLSLVTPNTLLCIPLSRRMIAIATYEGQARVLKVNEIGVAGFNSVTAREARQIFSSQADFVYLSHDETIRHTRDLIQSLRVRQGKYSQLEQWLKHWFADRSSS
jgi:hypothetical protein